MARSTRLDGDRTGEHAYSQDFDPSLIAADEYVPVYRVILPRLPYAPSDKEVYAPIRLTLQSASTGWYVLPLFNIEKIT